MQKIKGKNFLLRKLQPIADKESIVSNINDKDILNKITLDYPYTDSDYQMLVEKFEKEESEINCGTISFIIDIDGDAVGVISLFGKNKNESKHRSEIGYWLGKKYWNKGIMTEAVKLIVNFAFKELDKKKLTIGFLEDNISSRRVAEKNGFKYEYLKKKEAFKEGKYKDIIYFTIFNGL